MGTAQSSSAAVPTDSTNLRNAVSLAAIRKHQEELQKIADANSGTRASGTPGYDASADYVANVLQAAGYAVTRQPFQFPFFEELVPSQFHQIAPNEIEYGEDDFAIMEYSGSGDVTAGVAAAGAIVIPPGPVASTSASGCVPADFNGFPAGAVALVQRGTCTFAEKATNAEAAGAKAVIIFNEGQPGRQEVLNGTLGGPDVEIPVIGTSFAVGAVLAALARTEAGVTVRVVTSTRSELRSTSNVIADTRSGRTDRVVVVGAHLDSVPGGPGINDNGSGSAALLEIAVQMANLTPRNRVRFAFWGAEESGLLGAEFYVAELNKRQIQDIALNLNFDMLGSPNFVRYVYDGDGSDTPDAGPNGSSVIEDVFLRYFAARGLATEATAFDGRSDYGPFIAAGIPAGGLFSGAEEIKTETQARIFGGTAGEALDPCYHLACDTFTNNNDTILDQFADAAADAVLQFAMTTSAVKGTSKANDRAVKSVPLASLAHRGRHLQR